MQIARVFTWAFCVYWKIVGVVARMNQYKLQKVHVFRVYLYTNNQLLTKNRRGDGI